MVDAEEQIATISRERQDAVAYASHLETIRINRWRPWDEWNRKIGSLDTTTQNLDVTLLEPDSIYVMTNLTGLGTGTKPTTVALGYIRTDKFMILTKQTPANNNDSVDYVGQVILREGDMLRAEFKGATEGDTIELFANGYYIKL